MRYTNTHQAIEGAAIVARHWHEGDNRHELRKDTAVQNQIVLDSSGTDSILCKNAAGIGPALCFEEP